MNLWLDLIFWFFCCLAGLGLLSSDSQILQVLGKQTDAVFTLHHILDVCLAHLAVLQISQPYAFPVCQNDKCERLLAAPTLNKQPFN